ncbi:fasciclin domain-containing protein [Streptomyces sp. NPDC005438]|uniref:fasciclin domain-containing protein n=1 Tax=Streptomyces sp. NPDC005438 TaxID=3156880 RepID=UPI0033B1D704
MNTHRALRGAAALAAVVLLPLGLTACSDDGDDSGSKGDSSPSADRQKQNKAADKPFGPGCASVPKNGKGSFDGMAEDPVATAASNNPALSTLVGAVKKAGLVDTLNSAENITVFAPTNDAFDKVPKKDLDALMKDKAALKKVLTYHVVGEPLTPKKLEKGSYPTLAKSSLTTAGSGTSYQVNGNSSVVCGDVKTSNATVYLVDTVLMPKS